MKKASSSGNSKARRERNYHKFLSDDKSYVYHISIIDYLQKWNLDKILENKTKTWLL